MRIGLDNIMGYITFEQAKTSVNNLEKVNIIDAEVVKQHIGSTQIIDLRGASEYKLNHIETADNIFVGTLPDNTEKINSDQKIIIHCQGGDRASLGYSLLVKHGFNNILNYSAGMNDWVKQVKENA